MSQKVKKAIIPAAGLGTRFLPATKTVPKEMLTICDAPIIFYVVEEAVKAGIEDIILIQGRGKTAIEDFFDTTYELEDRLAKDGKSDILKRLDSLRDNVNIISIRQKQPLGLGHAVLCGLPIVGNSPFAVMLGDEIMITPSQEENTIGTLARINSETGNSCVAVMEVEANEVSKYGIADVTPLRPGLFEVKGFVEKPKPAVAPSRWALPGRYVFQPEIFGHLQNAKPGINGEIQLTDAMNAMSKNAATKMLASTFKSQRFDAGDKLGYLMANIEIGLKSPELQNDLMAFMKKVVQR
jgi:UTP--glucose-1-phosphate uridylyltransferase